MHENRKVKSIPRHCIIASPQKPPAAKLWSLGWVLLPYPQTPYILYNLFHVILPRLSREGCSLVVLDPKHMVVKRRHCSVKVTSSYDIAPQRIWGLIDAYYKRKSQFWAGTIIHYSSEGGIENTFLEVTFCHHVGNGNPSDGFFLFNPQTNDIF